MSVTETIAASVHSLPLKEQVKVLHMIHGMNAERRKAAKLAFEKAYGALTDEDGEAFEAAIATSRPLPDHG